MINQSLGTKGITKINKTLKPCPHCGKDVKVGYYGFSTTYYFISCCTSTEYTTSNKFWQEVELWSRRD